MSIYVEILVRAPMASLLDATQSPGRHERWDLRFSTIEYAPHAGDAGPQQFRYATRIGFGRDVSGYGETTGARHLADGAFSSALTFGSDDPLSLISRGSGYWKYLPTKEGVRFLTRYDYRTRFGAAGALLDAAVFRPLMAWATAWSFDRLRLWLEQQIDPRLAVRTTAVHVLARVTLALVFAYHGLVPKLIVRHPDEVFLIQRAGLPDTALMPAIVALGLVEVAFALALLFYWSHGWPVWLCAAAMPFVTAAVAREAPWVFGAAFNPFSLNLAILSLSVIDLAVLPFVPSASRCTRRPHQEHR
jgi:hypothetical protein